MKTIAIALRKGGGRIIDRIKKERYTKGLVVAYFTHTGKLYFWEEDRLK